MEHAALMERPLAGVGEENAFDLCEGLSYPEHYEVGIALPDVGWIKVRPIRPQDVPLFIELFDTLTPRTVYLRFFSVIKELTPEMIERFTHIDFDQEIALVALLEDGGRRKMVGVGRVITTSRPHGAEFSILVSDPWQGKGIGACLLKHCLTIARERGFKHICGTVLPENRQMLALGRKLGFAVNHVAGSTEYELSKTIECHEKRSSDTCRRS